MASARAARSAGKTPRSGARRCTRPTIAAQLERTGSCWWITAGTLSMPVHASIACWLSRARRTPSAGSPAIASRPFSASDHGLGTREVTTMRVPLAAFAVSRSTYSMVMRPAYPGGW